MDAPHKTCVHTQSTTVREQHATSEAPSMRRRTRNAALSACLRLAKRRGRRLTQRYRWCGVNQDMLPGGAATIRGQNIRAISRVRKIRGFLIRGTGVLRGSGARLFCLGVAFVLCRCCLLLLLMFRFLSLPVVCMCCLLWKVHMVDFQLGSFILGLVSNLAQSNSRYFPNILPD